MIDTLKLVAEDFEIAKGAGLYVQPATVDYRTGETNERRLFMAGGAWVTGEKAFVNVPMYQLTIKPLSSSSSDSLLFVQMSLPKVIKGENCEPLSAEETVDALAAVAGDLHARGVGVNLQTCKPSRIDLFRMAAANHPFSSYASMFRLLRAKRSRSTDYGTTFSWVNTQREVCVYDKAVEMQNRGVRSSALPVNAMRVEYRLKTARVCKDATGAGSVRELVNNLEHLPTVYRNALEKSVFARDVDTLVTVTAAELENGLRAYALAFGGKFINRFYRDYGAYMLGQQAGSEGVKLALSQVVTNRFARRRVCNEFDKNRANFAFAGKVDNLGNCTLKDLYSELKEKILPA